MNGTRYERQFVNLLDSLGFAVLRAPSSGSATERSLPDLTAARVQHGYPSTPGTGLTLWAVEHKSSSSDLVYIEPHEVDGLEEFAHAGGYEPLLAGRWKGDTTHYLKHPGACIQTDGGNYRLKRPDGIEDWDGIAVDPDKGVIR